MKLTVSRRAASALESRGTTRACWRIDGVGTAHIILATVPAHVRFQRQVVTANQQDDRGQGQKTACRANSRGWPHLKRRHRGGV